MHVTGDAESALARAFLGAPGVVVFAGTGSAAFGWNGKSHARAGGHGFLLGDEGSAYWIGRAPPAPRCAGRTGWAAPAVTADAVIEAARLDLAPLIGSVSTRTRPNATGSPCSPRP